MFEQSRRYHQVGMPSPSNLFLYYHLNSSSIHSLKPRIPPPPFSLLAFAQLRGLLKKHAKPRPSRRVPKNVVCPSTPPAPARSCRWTFSSFRSDSPLPSCKRAERRLHSDTFKAGGHNPSQKQEDGGEGLGMSVSPPDSPEGDCEASSPLVFRKSQRTGPPSPVGKICQSLGVRTRE